MRFSLLIVIITVIFMGLISEGVYAQHENFVLLYTFDRDEGGVAKDLSGKGNDGMIADAMWTADGKFGGGMEFNGTTSLIEVPHDDSLNPGGDQITIMTWFKPLSFPEGHPPIARKGQVGAGVGCWGFDTPNGTPRGFTYMAETGAPSIAQGASTMVEGEWNHLAMVYDGTQVRVYLNGQLDGTTDITGNINENNDVPVWIGKKATEDIFLHGIIDDLAILNVGLSEAQIINYMENSLSMTSKVDASGKMAISWGEIKYQ
jgi:hypothetical protein